MTRLFIAIDLPEPQKVHLRTLCSGIFGARWMAPEQIHLTLRFIGEVDSKTFSAIAERLAIIQQESFKLRIRGVGHFPPRGEPKILWAGVEEHSGLTLLKTKIDGALKRLGLENDPRNFHPHITLARLKDVSSETIGEYIAHNNLFSCEPFWVSEFTLFSSTLNPQGSRYAIEAQYPLLTSEEENDENFS